MSVIKDIERSSGTLVKGKPYTYSPTQERREAIKEGLVLILIFATVTLMLFL